ncbi:IS1182 family transposase [Polaribacter reichenbachii]|uniref:Transposase n=1 Tax=Polaribacter reichenbachii TaxID=996801 RepID=A0A1B8TRJ3_9FLAO|nr:IS1182 family transposase [Polaribacter reichenbachii]APZ47810.1 IS1182 family transposase [Polaribacter reichenbachii]AUC18445.1 IS1182 family transposase [Polaribacter reichenbachii]OBY62204.1 transposase [Polaribacter reichenbachii]
MLSQQQVLKLSEYSSLYDLIVPKDNLLRKINDLIDFDFIYKELLDKYSVDQGRTAECPIKLFKYLLLKVIYTISDVDVVERSRYDMSFKYFLDMLPEDDVINPSTLTKFRRQCLKDTNLLNLLINKTVGIAVEKGIIRSSSIIVDATHTLSKSNPVSAIDVLRERSKQLRKAVYVYQEDWKDKMPVKNDSNDLGKEISYSKELETLLEASPTIREVPSIKEKLNLLKESIDEIEHHKQEVVSKDIDAKIGHKSADSSFFGFKTHLAMSEERIITAAVVTSGEKGDGPILPELISQSQNNGIVVDTVIGDAAYSGKINLEKAKQENIQIVARLNPTISQGIRKKEEEFDYNKDADMFVCPAGHMAIRKAIQGKKNVRENQVITYYFDVEKCKNCPLKKGCYKEGAKTKTYSISIKSEIHQEQIDFEKSTYFKEKSKHRYKIEAKNGELKNVHGYGRAISYGIENMQMQGALTIFAVNLKRILKLN